MPRLLRLFVPALAVSVLFIAALLLQSSHSPFVAASEPTPVPPPFPPQIPIEQMAHQDAHKRADALPVQPLDSMVDKPCIDGKAGGYFLCSNVDLDAFMPLADLGGGEASSSWGWTDPDTGKEYALLGRSNGTSFVDISNPKAPVYLGNLPTHTGSSAWRELKTYGYYALIVSDVNGEHGMQIFDLRQLRNVANPPATFSESAHYAGFANGHTITVNSESGYAYVNGSNTCSGGLHIVDVRDAMNPKFVACYSGDGYTHDSQCVTYHGPDAAYANHEICFAANQDTLTLVDVTDKSSLKQIARKGYFEFGYTHQGWLTPDQKYFVVDDEFDEVDYGHTAYTYIWDVRALDNPQLLNTFHARFRAIDHNQYIKGDRIYQANYRAGLHILDASHIAQGKLREVGFFDIFPADDKPNFNAAWNVYPFYNSGVVTIAGIEQGLFIVQPQPEANPPPCNHKPNRTAPQAPADHAAVKRLRVSLVWDANACASNYQVILREQTAHGNLVRERVTLTETQYKTQKLAHNKTYLWNVRACNAWGCAKGARRTFTTQ